MPLLAPFLAQMAEIKRSLRAKTLSDPEAQRRLSAATAEYERLEASARVRVAGNLPTLSEEGIPFLAKSYTHRLQLSLSNTHFDLDDKGREWLAASAWRYVPLAFMAKEHCRKPYTTRSLRLVEIAGFKVNLAVPSRLDAQPFHGSPFLRGWLPPENPKACFKNAGKARHL